jgi:hypothetical protein
MRDGRLQVLDPGRAQDLGQAHDHRRDRSLGPTRDRRRAGRMRASRVGLRRRKGGHRRAALIPLVLMRAARVAATLGRRAPTNLTTPIGRLLRNGGDDRPGDRPDAPRP